MTSNTSPFERFRERQHELNETPPTATWKRLEKRLEKHQRRSRLTFRRHAGMAAAMLLMISLTFLISFTLGKKAVFQGITGPVSVLQFEELSSENTDSRSLQAIALHRQYTQTTVLSIPEGDAKQKLKVKMQ